MNLEVIVSGSRLSHRDSDLVKREDGQRQHRNGHERDAAEQSLPAADAVDDGETQTRGQHLHEPEPDRRQRRAELGTKPDLGQKSK